MSKAVSKPKADRKAATAAAPRCPATQVTFSGQVDLTAPQGQTGHLPARSDGHRYLLHLIAHMTAGDADRAARTTHPMLQADNSITVNSAISSNSTHTLTLDAPNTTLNAGISLPNGTLEFTNIERDHERHDEMRAGATIVASRCWACRRHITRPSIWRNRGECHFDAQLHRRRDGVRQFPLLDRQRAHRAGWHARRRAPSPSSRPAI